MNKKFKSKMKYLLIPLLIINYAYALEYNIIVYKDKNFRSSNSIIGDLNDRIEEEEPLDIIDSSNVTEPTPPTTPTVDDSLCEKSEGKTCQLTFSSTDDGEIEDWSILDSNSNTISYNVVDNVVSFTVPRAGTNISITAIRIDDEEMESNPYSYNFTRTEDLSIAFKTTLTTLCGIPEATFDTYWDSVSGWYDGDINCESAGLTDSDLQSFSILKGANGYINLNDNHITDLSLLNSDLAIFYIHLEKTDIVDYSPMDNWTFGWNIIYIDLFDDIIEKKMSETSSFCRSNKESTDQLYRKMFEGDPYLNNKYIICDYGNTYGQDDVDFLTTISTKCDVYVEEQGYWNSETGTYNSSISCINKGLTNTDLNTFTPLKNVSGGLFLQGANNFTNTSGLRNLETIGNFSFSLANNPNLVEINLPKFATAQSYVDFSNLTSLTSISAPLLSYIGNDFRLNDNNNLSNINSIGSNLELNNIDLTETDIVDYSPMDNWTFNDVSEKISISLWGKMIEKKMSETSSFCQTNPTSTNELYRYYNSGSTTTLRSKYIICDYGSNYGTDDVAFLNTLNDKCGYGLNDRDIVQMNWKAETGTYNSSIDCGDKGLTNTDLETFAPLKNVNGNLYLDNNSITSLSGLDNLEYVETSFQINNNSVSDLNILKSDVEVGNIYLQETDIVDLSPMSDWIFNGYLGYKIKMSTWNNILEKKMNETGSYCRNNPSATNELERYYNSSSFYTNKSIVCDYGSNYGEDDVELLTSLVNLCGIGTQETIQQYWNSETETFNGSIICRNKGLTSGAFLNPIKNLNGDLDIAENSISSYNLYRDVTGSFYFENNNSDKIMILGNVGSGSTGNHFYIYGNNFSSINTLSNITSSGNYLRIDDKVYFQKLSSSTAICDGSYSWDVANGAGVWIISGNICDN